MNLLFTYLVCIVDLSLEGKEALTMLTGISWMENFSASLLIWVQWRDLRSPRKLAPHLHRYVCQETVTTPKAEQLTNLIV